MNGANYMIIMKKIVVTFSLVVFSLFLLNSASVFASSDSSKIGPIDVSGMSKKEKNIEVRKIIESWQKSGIVIQIAGDEITVPGTAFNFDSQRSVEALEKLQQKPWYDFWSKTPAAQTDLIVHATDQLRTAVENRIGKDELEEKMDELLVQAGQLPNRPLKLTVDRFDFKDGKVVSTAVVPLKQSEIEVLTAYAKQVNGKVMKPESEFSYMKHFGVPHTVRVGSLMATVLYQNALSSGFEIIERHQALTIPNYADAGYEAVIKTGENQDLKFTSTHRANVKIQAIVEKNHLIVSFYVAKGDRTDDVRVYAEGEKLVEAKEINRYSKELEVGHEEVVQQPKNGLVVEIYRQITSKESGREKSIVSSNYYAPKHKVILKSMARPQPEPEEPVVDEEIPSVDEEPVAPESEEPPVMEEENEDLSELPNRPTADQLENAELVYSEDDDSYYYIYTIDKEKGEGQK